jgi:hypothetical protein
MTTTLGRHVPTTTHPCPIQGAVSSRLEWESTTPVRHILLPAPNSPNQESNLVILEVQP